MASILISSEFTLVDITNIVPALMEATIQWEKQKISKQGRKEGRRKSGRVIDIQKLPSVLRRNPTNFIDRKEWERRHLIREVLHFCFFIFLLIFRKKKYLLITVFYLTQFHHKFHRAM